MDEMEKQEEKTKQSRQWVVASTIVTLLGLVSLTGYAFTSFANSFDSPSIFVVIGIAIIFASLWLLERFGKHG